MNWLQKAILTGIVFVLIVWFIQNGISNRPVINYKFEGCPKEISFYNYETQKQESVALGILNSGNTDSQVILHFIGNNVEILNETKQPYTTINGTNVYVDFQINKQLNQYYFGEKIYFMINKSVDTFSYSYEVTKKNSDNSISGLINRLFGEVKGFYPTTCEYKKQTTDFGYSRFTLIN